MTQNIHKLFKALFLACIMLVSTQAAAQGPGPCCQPNECNCEPECFCKFPNYNPCCTGIGDGAQIMLEFLWWKPCFNNLDFATKTERAGVAGSDLFENDDYKAIHHEWMPGLRVGLEMDSIYGNWDMRFNYTWFLGKNSDEVDGPIGTLQSTLFHPGIITFPQAFERLTASHSYQYHSFDVLFGQNFRMGSCQEMFPFFGIQGIKLDQVIKSDGFQDGVSRAQFRWESCYEALGLEMGGDYYYSLSSDLEVFAHGAFSLLAGGSKSTNRHDDNNDEKTVIFHTSNSICTPGVHLKAGANYTIESCGQEFFLTVGYEFLQWFNMPQTRRFLSDGADNIGLSTTPNGSRIGFHGLFVGVGISL